MDILDQAQSTRTDGGAAPIGLSLVVPILNEAEAIGPFLARVLPIVEALMRRQTPPLDFEIVFVDDGSSDDGVTRLMAQRRNNPAIKIVSLSRNFGKDAALMAGLDHVRGAAVVPLDADLQDPPEAIPEMYAKWREGYDIVFATRTDRGSDSLAKRASAGLFYRLFNAIAETRIPNNAGYFRLLDRRVVEALKQLPERNRFMKGLYAWVGFRHASVAIVREARVAGASKWRYWSLWNFALDGIAAFSSLPLRVWSYVGGAIAAASFAYALFLIVHTLILGADVPGYASLMVAVLFMGGINLMTLGILGEYIGRTYTEAKRRPLYLVRERIGFAADGADSNSEQ
jgi:glycosyltransferase involved in cell wall biosynthesis